MSFSCLEGRTNTVCFAVSYPTIQTQVTSRIRNLGTRFVPGIEQSSQIMLQRLIMDIFRDQDYNLIPRKVENYMQYSLKYTKDHFFFIYGKNACPFHKKSTCRLSVIAANGKTRRGKRHFLQKHLHQLNLSDTLDLPTQLNEKFPVINSSIPLAISRLKLNNEQAQL